MNPDVKTQIVASCIRATTHFASFVRLFWQAIEPARELVWNWHLDVLCDAIQKQVDGDPAYRRLLILIPPGYMKSVLVSVMRPAWVWLRRPSRRSIYFSHSEHLAVRDSRRTRDIVKHDLYAVCIQVAAQIHKTPIWSIKPDQDEKVNFENTATGLRQCFGLYSEWTGARADDIGIDDPVNAQDVINGTPDQVAARLAQARDLINNSMQSRVNDKKTATWMLVQQRLDENDPAGDALRDGDWKVICIPQEFDPSHPLYDPKVDPRTVVGETINPAFDDPAEIAREKRKMLAHHWSAQRQQWPLPVGAGIFTRPALNALPTWTDLAEERAGLTEIALSIDCTFANTEGSDRVSMQVWGRRGYGVRSLLARTCRRMTYVETKAELLRMYREHHPDLVLVENKANGPAVLSDLAEAVPCLVPYDPGRTQKTVRAQIGLSPLVEGKQIRLPDEQAHPWVGEVKASLVHLRPGGKDDDDADAATQINAYWTQRAKQAPWIDVELATPTETTRRPAWTSATGAAAHYIHDPAVLIALPAQLFVAVVPPVRSPGCAVVVTDQGDIVGHVIGEELALDGFCGAVVGLCRQLVEGLVQAGRMTHAGRIVDTPTVARGVTLRVVLPGGKDAALADATAEALRARGLYPRLESAQDVDPHRVVGARAWWTPTPGALALAATQAAEHVEYGRWRIHDPVLRELVRNATLDAESGVPDVPLTRDVAARMLPRPVAKDALLVALLAASDAFVEFRSGVIASPIPGLTASTAKQQFAEHIRLVYGGAGGPKAPTSADLWAATSRR